MKEEGKASKDAEALYGLYQRHGALSDRQAGRLTGKMPALVSARRNELVTLGKVAACGTMYDADTRRNVKIWGIRG